MSEENHKGERIAKVMARAGLCSRREAEAWIEAGRVKVNGERLQSAACVVGVEDKIEVDGKALGRAEDTRLFLYHKPSGLVTSHKDERGRKTVFDALRSLDFPGRLPRVMSVGRLDLNTEGLLLLTNDGGLSRYLELPATGWSRRYRVRVLGAVDEARLADLKGGITVEGVRYKSIEAKLEQTGKSGANRWIFVTLREGKNREIRRVMEALGLQVNRLIRVGYGPFELNKLPSGGVQEVEARVMKAQIPGYFKDCV
ncbi:MAG: rRNA pseudouridine synthase [Alphaproteobacteria bacterium]|nr:rRNA pseudouridine synthase [Alphaproteobacteria bacterium]